MKSQHRGLKGWRACLASLGISLVYFALIYLIWGFHYAINDDTIMRNISSGRMTGTPDGHLIFMKYTLGWLISRLFLLVSCVDWYGFFLIGIMMLCLALLLNHGIRREKAIGWKAVYVLFTLTLFTAVMFLHVVLFEWTLAAVTAGATAVYLYFARGRDTSAQVLFDDLSVAVLLWCTYNIRSEIFIMLCPMLGIFFLWELWKEREERGRIFCLFRPILLTACSVLLTGAVEKAAYTGEEWDAYARWNNARSEVMDYYNIPYYEGNEAFYDSISVTPQEVRNLRHYAVSLTDWMQGNRMELIAEEARRQYEEASGTFRTKLYRAVQVSWKGFSDIQYFPVSVLSVLALLLALFISARYDRRYIGLCLLLASVQGALWFYLGYEGRLPERVAFSMHIADLALAMAVFMHLFFRRNVKLGRRTGILLGAFLLGTAIWSCVDTSAGCKRKLEMDRQYQEFIAYLQSQTDRIFFLDNHTEASRGDRVSFRKDFSLTNTLTLGDWYSFSPLDTLRSQRLGLEESGEALLTDERVYFASDRKIEYLQEYLRSVYGEIETEEIEVISQEPELTYTIYRFHLSSEE